MAMELAHLLPVELPKPYCAVVASAGNVGPAGMSLGNSAQRANHGRGVDGGRWLDFPGAGVAQVKDADVLIGAAGNDCRIVEGEYVPYGHALVAPQRKLRLPLVQVPDTRLAVPAAGDEIGTARGDVQRAHVVGVADEQALGVVGGARTGGLDFDDGVLAAGYDQSVWV